MALGEPQKPEDLYHLHSKAAQPVECLLLLQLLSAQTGSWNRGGQGSITSVWISCIGTGPPVQTSAAPSPHIHALQSPPPMPLSNVALSPLLMTLSHSNPHAVPPFPCHNLCRSESHLRAAALLEGEVGLPVFLAPFPVDLGVADNGSDVPVSIEACVEMQHDVILAFAQVDDPTETGGRQLIAKPSCLRDPLLRSSNAQ